MEYELIYDRLSKNSVFKLHEAGRENFKHLVDGTKSQSQIAKDLGRTQAAISDYKKRIGKIIDELMPNQKELIREQSRALNEMDEKANVLSIEELGSKIRQNIDECSEIIFDSSFLANTQENPIAYQNLRLRAMEKLEKSIVIYVDRYGSLSEVKASSELKKIKEKVAKTVNFLITKFPEDPSVVQDYVRFLDEREEKKEEKVNG